MIDLRELLIQERGNLNTEISEIAITYGSHQVINISLTDRTKRFNELKQRVKWLTQILNEENGKLSDSELMLRYLKGVEL